MNINVDLFKQFKQFAVPYIHCWDIDPVYPVLKEVHDRRGLDADQRIWHTLLYVTWYHMGSAEYVWELSPEPAIFNPAGLPVLPTGIERRGFRGEIGKIKAIEQLNWFYHLTCKMSLSCWVDNHAALGGKIGWQMMYDRFKEIKNNGTWASYKWCDLCKNVLGFNITAPDIGVGGGDEHAGPVPGMVQLTGENWKRCATDRALQQELLNYCCEQGIPFDGLEELETALCDFNSLTHNRYYVGHDIDSQQEQFTKMKVPPVYWKARKAVLPWRYLGEVNGWAGVRDHLKGKLL
jgi:hypothetical protein